MQFTAKPSSTGTVHIHGIEPARTSGGNDMGDHISYQAASACPAISRVYKWGWSVSRGNDLHAVVDAALETGKPVCENCLQAAERVLEIKG